jgi:hypothetical protein
MIVIFIIYVTNDYFYFYRCTVHFEDSHLLVCDNKWMTISNLDTERQTLSSTEKKNHNMLQNITERLLKNLMKNKKPKGPLPIKQS